PLDAGEDFQSHAALVDPAFLRGRLDHGKLAADVVRRHRYFEAILDPANDVEIGQGRLDHDDVGAFGKVKGDLAERLVAVGRVHLVAGAVAELGRRFGGVAERTVETGSVFGCVAHDRQPRVAGGVQPGADCLNHTVQHAAGRHQVGPGAGVA